MKADQFKRQVHQGEIPPVSLLYGEEPLLIQETLDHIRKKLSGGDEDSLDQEVFHGSDSDALTIHQSSRTLPLFGARKLILVRGIDQMPDPQKDILLEQIKNPLSNVYMVLTAVKPDMRKRFFVQLQKHYPAVRFYHPYDERQTQSWIRTYLKPRGFQIDSEAAHFLCDAHGRELQVLKNELEKLILYKGEKGTIGLSEVSEISGQSQEFNAFELADAVGSRDVERALRVLTHLVDEGIPLLMIVGALAAKFRKLWMGKKMEREGCTDREIQHALKVTYKGDLFLKQMHNFQEKEIEGVFPLLLSIDEMIKSGRSRPEIFMEMAIQRICRGNLRGRRETVNLFREN
jgi:DNA polymerase-3 subunit delta